MEIDIRPYCAGDEDNILSMFDQTFKKKMSRDWWQWRFLENPVDKPRIYLAFDQERLVSHYAVSPFELQIDGVKKLAALSMTTMTDSAYQSLSLFPKTAACLYRDLVADGYIGVVGFPNNLSHVPFIEKLGWQDISAQHSLRLIFKNIRRKRSEISFEVTHASACAVGPVQAVDEAVASIQPVYDGKSWAWRFNKASGNDYFVVKAFYPNRDVVGTVVYKKYQDNDVDLVYCVLKEKAALLPMLDCIHEHVGKEDGLVFNTWATLNTPLHRSFESLGALAASPVTFFGGIQFDSNLKFFDNSKWNVAMALSDLY